MFDKKLFIRITKDNKKIRSYFDIVKLYLIEIRKKDKRRTRKKIKSKS